MRSIRVYFICFILCVKIKIIGLSYCLFILKQKCVNRKNRHQSNGAFLLFIDLNGRTRQRKWTCTVLATAGSLCTAKMLRLHASCCSPVKTKKQYIIYRLLFFHTFCFKIKEIIKPTNYLELLVWKVKKQRSNRTWNEVLTMTKPIVEKNWTKISDN